MSAGQVNVPERIADTGQLEELLSEPTEQAVETLARLEAGPRRGAAPAGGSREDGADPGPHGPPRLRPGRGAAPGDRGRPFLQCCGGGLDPGEGLGPGQAEEIDRVYRAYPHLHDDEFVARHREDWLGAGGSAPAR